MQYQNIRSALFSFVTIHASDGQTDRRTGLRQQYRALHYMQPHGKNAGLDQYGPERFGRFILPHSEKYGNERVN